MALSDSLIVYICILSHLLYQSLLSYALSTYPPPPHNTPLSTSVCINQNTGNLALIWHYLNISSYSGLVNFCSNLLYIYSLLLPVQDPIQNHLCIYLSCFFHSYQIFFHSKKFPQHFFVFLDLDSFEKIQALCTVLMYCFFIVRFYLYVFGKNRKLLLIILNYIL